MKVTFARLARLPSIGESTCNGVDYTSDLLAFLIMMKLASQVEYLTSLMKLALRSMSTSSLTVLCHSSLILLFFCDIGLAWEQIVSLWQIMLAELAGNDQTTLN